MAQRPREHVAWSEEYLRVMYRDWGSTFTYKDQLDVALLYYNRSLGLNPNDPKTLHLLSKCNLKVGQTKKALKDCNTAADFKQADVDFDLTKCRALYECNDFEGSKVEMHDKARIYGGRKVEEFKNMIAVVDENFRDTIGSSYGPFIMKSPKHLYTVYSEIERRKHVQKRPLWKILRDTGKCDILSILEKEDELLHPREVARRDRAFRVFTQVYMNTSWRDVLFLRDLRKNPLICWPQSKMSSPFLKNLVDSKYETVKSFEKMLHTRSPLYNDWMVKFGSKKLMDRNREITLYRVQYETRRNMMNILKTIKKLREDGQVEKLAKYIEDKMGNYVVLKTQRVMPWKFEFMNDVYNTLALAYADRYIKLPPVPENVPSKKRLFTFLRLPTDNKEKPAFVFGDKSTYQEPDAVDHAVIAYRKHVAHLEKRLVFAEYPIEKCYLYHEIARAHLKRLRFAESIIAAKKSIEVVKLFNNNLWAFLGYIIIVKANVFVHKLENIHEALDAAYELSVQLNSSELLSFVATCQEFNNKDIQARKHSRNELQLRKLKGRMSVASTTSSNSWNDHGSGDDTASYEIL